MLKRARARVGPSDAQFLVAAFCAVAIAIGLGRFAYTPLLPLMQSQARLTHTLAGVLASANLTGYLIGAFIASQAALRAHRVAVIRWCAALCILTTVLAAFPETGMWLASRFLSGMGSGCVFVLISSVVLDRAALESKPAWPAISFGGAGGGIALCGILVPILAPLGGWQGAWLGLCAVFAIIALVTLPWIADVQGSAQADPRELRAIPAPRAGLFPWLFVVYGVEGLGYIIPATFMVAIIAGTPSIARLASLGWVIAGSVAIVAPLAWLKIGASLGRAPALIFVLALQAGGIAVPALFHNAAGVVVGALALGGTFSGISLLANALGRELYPIDSHVAVGRLTVSYGVGQILGPLLATALNARTGSYDPALLAAALAVGLGALVMGLGMTLNRPIRARAG